MEDMKTLFELPWYVKVLVLLARFLRKIHLGKIVLKVREKVVLETLTRIHFDTIHLIRRFSVNGHFFGILGEGDNAKEPFEDLADGIRDTMAKHLAVAIDDLHCTIKYLQGSDDIDKKDWKVYTLARSTPCNRPAEFWPSDSHSLGLNSSFAALVGCDDPSNKWSSDTPYICFACNDLREHEQYECTRENWRKYFKCTFVFPLRYRKITQKTYKTVGFLTFDSNMRNIFGDIPNIFEYMGKPEEYRKAMLASSVCHLGGLIADMLATTIYLQEEFGGKR